ncbi:MAG: hypothetical protein AAGI10_10675 [Pseudomonadota bacterium]
MSSKVIRIERVSFDATRGAYDAQLTLAAPTGPVMRQVRVAGHRSWGAPQIIAALKNEATGFTLR